jgi:hypothetical protein
MAAGDAAYEHSVLTWDKLRRYAERVARDTKAPRHTVVTRSEEWVEEVVGRTLFGKPKTEKIRRMAKRSEVSDHWVLDERTHRLIRRLDGQNTSTDVVKARYCLLSNEALVVRIESYDEFEGPRYDGYREGTHTVEERPFGDDDVLLFDYAPDYRWSGGDVFSSMGRGRRTAHAKGVGLSIRLKKLLESA